jgi:hypothetical protein
VQVLGLVLGLVLVPLGEQPHRQRNHQLLMEWGSLWTGCRTWAQEPRPTLAQEREPILRINHRPQESDVVKEQDYHQIILPSGQSWV